MGLDMWINEEGESKTNSRGQKYWKVTRICEFRNTWRFLKELGLENCKAEDRNGEQLWEACHAIEDQNEQNTVAIKLRDGKVENSCEKYYQVEAWW